MAKASPIDGLDAKTPFDQGAPRALTVRLLDVRAYEDAILHHRDADVVHDMRVATRRLRAAIGMFGRGDRLEEAAAEVKGLGRALGHVRDLDVQLEWLEHTLAEPDRPADERTGIAHLAEDRRGRLDEPTRGLEQAVIRFASDVVPRLEKAFARVTGGGTMGGKRMRGRITRRLRVIEEAGQAVLDSPDPHTAHQLRIKVKKLRYEAELLDYVLHDATAPLLAALQPLQELLGDLHDTDERQALLERFLLGAPPEDQPGALSLLKRVLADRERLAAELVTELRRWQAERLGKALRAPLK
jgi:CHAD domain-containing protein